MRLIDNLLLSAVIGLVGGLAIVHFVVPMLHQLTAALHQLPH